MKRCLSREGDWTLSEVIFDLVRLQHQIAVLEQRTQEPGFWDDPTSANKDMKELSRLRDIVVPFSELRAREREIADWNELLQLEPNEELRTETDETAIQFLKDLDDYELKTLLRGEHDHRNALFEINAGAGGSEACDWAAILFRLYNRWAERKGYKIEILSETPGDVTGYRGVQMLVTGPNAYGYLKCENGVHRLVRISPFDAAARRQRHRIDRPS